MPQMLLFGNYLHGSAAKHKARAYQNGVAYLGGGMDALLDIGHRTSFWLRDAQIGEQLLKSVAVFGTFDGVTIGADDVDTSLA